MNRLFRLLITGFLGCMVVGGIAQPSFILNSEDVEVGDEVEISLVVDNFTDISDVALSLNWDPNFLNFLEISSINRQDVADLDFNDFDEGQVINGKLALDWETLGIASIRLEDSTWLFKATFEALQEGTTAINFTDDPMPINIIRDVPNVTNPVYDSRDLQGEFLVNSTVTIGKSTANVSRADPLGLNLQLEEEFYCVGDEICYTLEVENFDSILGFQTPVFWDSTILRYVGLENPVISQLSASNRFGAGAILLVIDFAAGDIDVEILNNGLSLEDGSGLVDICFEVLDQQAQESIIDMGDTPLVAAESTFNNAREEDLAVQVTASTFESVDCDEVVILNTSCQNGGAGETVCVTVSAVSFPDVANILYTHTWDTDIMDFVEIRSINSALAGLEAIPDGAGRINIDWTVQGTAGVNLPRNSTLYDICFQLKADVQEGQTSVVQIDRDGVFFSDIINNPKDSRISDRCAVEVGEAPTPIINIDIPDTTFINEGSTACIEVSVENFTNVDFVQFPITWDENVLRFTRLDLDLLGNTTVNQVGGDEVIIQWQNTDSPVSFQGRTAILSLCFEAIGDANNQATSESAIVFSGSENILITSSNVPLPFSGAQAGLVILEAIPASAVTFSTDLIENRKRGETVCVPVTASNFTDISNISLLVAWDSTILQYNETINFNEQFAIPSANTTSSENGILNFTWGDDTNTTPVTIDNESPLFEVCFTVIGNLGECAQLTFPTTYNTEEGTLNATLVNSNQEELRIVGEGQDICLTTFGINEATVIQPSCEGDGSIEVQLVGGNDYSGMWNFFINGVSRSQTENATAPDDRLEFGPITADIDSVCLTVFDRTNASLNDSRCWVTEVSDIRIPIAIAGDDVETGCDDTGEIEVVLTGDFNFGENDTAMTAVGVIDFDWRGINGGNIDPFTTSGRSATATSPGTYILTVTVVETGCSSTDTLEVIQSQLPTVSVAEVESITCENRTVTLVGEGDRMNEALQFQWRNEVGDTLTGDSPFEVAVMQGGTYTFFVENTASGCLNQESITVEQDTIAPIAEAGRNMLKRCEDNNLTLDGTGSDAGALIQYNWSTPSNAPILGVQSRTPQVTRVGTYFIEVTNIGNGCVATDSVRVEADPELPVALAVPEAFIGCGESPSATLDGSPTREFTNANFLYTWKQGDNIIAEGRETALLDNVMVKDTGEYLLIIINTENDLCIADTARVQVSVDNTMPGVRLPNNVTIGCTGDCIDLPATVTDMDGDFEYVWSTEDGFICSGENARVAQISTFGTYELILTNRANSCADTAKVFVFPDEENTVAADAGASRDITCTQDSVLLDGRGSSQAPSHTYEWRFEGTTISTELQVMVGQPGTYELVVSDAETGCVDNASVMVGLLEDIPTVDAGNDIQFSGCDFPVDPPIALVATNSDSGEDFETIWTTAGGEILGDSTSLITTIGAPGVYTLTVTNIISGCSSSDEVVVSSDIFTPIGIIEAPNQLDCNNSTLTLDAQSSDVDPNVTIRWITTGGNFVSGENTLSPVIDEPGIYTLTLTSENGCEDETSITISANENMPVAEVVMDNLRIVCNEQMTIDASNSSSGENIVVSWTTTDGRIVSGANTLLPEVAAGGTYLLTIEDTVSNCIATKEVIVESDDNLPNAVAGEDQETCTGNAILQANELTASITGVWTALNGGTIDVATDASTDVTALSPGANNFVWTLSTEDCPNYSSDTVLVNLPTMPVAVDDNFVATTNQTTTTLNLIGNDQTNTLNFSVNIISSINNGTLTEVSNGVYEYTIPTNFLGREEFQYELCSETCLDICDNATVSLAITPSEISPDETTPNAITPNGDGLNDFLIFDKLFFDNFSNSELVVFNRWGDIVYQVSPYNNDWQGVNSDGSALPEGTYYYVLRLDIGEGDIIRGDVTVLR